MAQVMGGVSLSGSTRSTVLRPRLLQSLQTRFTVRLVALVASAGFGKSTLLAQSIHENALSPVGLDVWVTCSADHNALSVLLGDLLAGLDAPAATNPPTDPRAAAQLVCEAVLAQAPRQVALILDDLHTLSPQGTSLAFVRALVELLPASGHLVVASRPPLPLPVTRLLASGRALLLQEAELAFADDELVRFAVNRGVDAGLVTGISGWPALAELIAATGRRHVADFLWEEVLDGLTSERLEMLSVLAQIGGADDALISELLHERVDLRAMLHDLPLVDASSDGWWSLHPLWESALRARTATARVERALREAPAVLRSRGLVRHGMRVLLERGLWDDLEPVVVDACGGIAAEVPADVLAVWYARLPEFVRQTGAGRLLAGTAIKGDDPAAGQCELAQAATTFRATGHEAGEFACLLGLFQIAFWRNDVASLRPILQRWRAMASDGVRAAQIASALGRALLADDPRSAKAELAAVPAGATGALAVLVDWMRAHLLLSTLGEPEQAATFAARVMEHAPITLRSSIRCELVEAYRMLGRSEAAHAESAAMLAETTEAVVRSPRHLVAAIVLAAFCGDAQPGNDPAPETGSDPRQSAAALGGAASVRELLVQLRPLAQDSHLPWSSLAEAIATAAAHAGYSDDLAQQALAAVEGDRLATPLVLLRISPAALPLNYVLRPSSRTTWQEADLEGTLAQLLRLARAMVEIREGQSGHDSQSALDALSEADIAAAYAQLPVPWCVHLGVALVARGHLTGTRLVLRHGAAARGPLRRLDVGSSAQAKAARTVLSLIPATPSHPVTIQVLGPLAAIRSGVAADDANVRRERVRQLLGFLVVHRSTSRHLAASTLWPDLDDASAAKNLRVTLNYLQQVLEPGRDERDAPYFLRARGTMLELGGEPHLQVDLWAAERALDQGDQAERQGTPSLALTAYLQAAELYQGDLLTDLPPDPWLVEHRDRVRVRVTAAMVRAGNLLLATGDHTRAESLARRAVAAQPWSEDAYHVLVEALLARGDRPAAQRILDRCFDMLIDLGVEAGSSTVDLADRVRSATGR